MELRDILKKVVLLGDGGVGKTSLIARYVVNKFDDKYIATIGTKVSRKDIQVVKPNLIINLRMMIWDILGQKEYSKIRSASLSGAQGLILVGDLSRPETIKSLQDFWLKEVHAQVGMIPTVVVGNKVDLAEKNSMTAAVMEAMGQRLGYQTLLTSAKTGANVEEIFNMLGDLLVADLVGAQAKMREKPPQSLAEVVDFIVQDFCAQYGDLEKAMLIVQHQFEDAGVDIRKPQKESVLQALDGLAKAEELSLTKSVARVNLEERQRMVILAKG
ncbi:MAG: GTP-binding protein [Thermoplasmatota archaeon]|nr:GTP-binding protein [Candidatus Thermoplasmatota archaeon]MBU1914605.1 GTP-binding protein [Candidatus Thermoplasmatota archaeon]